MEQARSFYETAKEIKMSVHGPRHPLVAHTVFQLGGLCDFGDGDPRAALELYRDALQMYRDGNAANRDIGDVLCNMAVASGAIDADEGEEANGDDPVELFEQALELQTEALGSHAAAVATTKFNMAGALGYDGSRAGEAFELEKQALLVFVSVLGPESDMAKYTWEDMATRTVWFNAWPEMSEAVVKEDSTPDVALAMFAQELEPRTANAFVGEVLNQTADKIEAEALALQARRLQDFDEESLPECLGGSAEDEDDPVAQMTQLLEERQATPDSGEQGQKAEHMRERANSLIKSGTASK